MSSVKKEKLKSDFFKCIRHGICSSVMLYSILSREFLHEYASNPFTNYNTIWKIEKTIPYSSELSYAVAFGFLLADCFEWLFFNFPDEFFTYFLHHICFFFGLFCIRQDPHYPELAFITQFWTEISDFFLYAAKFVHHTEFNLFYFGEFLAVQSFAWWIARCICISLLLYSIMFYQVHPYKRLGCCFYSFLVLLSYFWTYRIGKVIVRELCRANENKSEKDKTSQDERGSVSGSLDSKSSHSGIQIIQNYCKLHYTETEEMLKKIE